MAFNILDEGHLDTVPGLNASRLVKRRTRCERPVDQSVDIGNDEAERGLALRPKSK